MELDLRMKWKELDLRFKRMELDLRLKWIELDHPDRDLHFSSGFVYCDVSSCGLNQTGTKLTEN